MKKWCAGLVGLILVAAACATPPPVEWSVFPDGAGLVEPTAPTLSGPLRIEHGQLVDTQGRVVTLRGTNLVNKSAPYVTAFTSEPSEGTWPSVFDGDDFRYLREMGYNAVRLGVWFRELIPSVGVIDESYLDDVDAMVTELESNGIYVVLDFHQDVFTGMPEWATTPTAAALSDEAPEILSFIGWAASYMSDRSLQQWKDLLNNAETATAPGVGMWDALGTGVAAVAQHFEGRSNLAGIELLNEPFPGIDYLRCITEGCVDVERKLSAGYDIMTALVRDVAPDVILWQEPIISAPHYGETSAPKPADDQTGFAWHTYCHATDGGELEPVDAFEQERCRAMVGTAHNRAAKRANAWGAPSLMTEFGASRNPLDAILVTNEADARVGSWLYWAFGFGMSPEIDSTLARVYPEATAGDPEKLTFDRLTGLATYRFDSSSAGDDAQTVLAIPPLHYPNGYTVTVSGGTVASAKDAAHLVVDPTPESLVTVTVRRT